MAITLRDRRAGHIPSSGVTASCVRSFPSGKPGERPWSPPGCSHGCGMYSTWWQTFGTQNGKTPETVTACMRPGGQGGHYLKGIKLAGLLTS